MLTDVFFIFSFTDQPHPPENPVFFVDEYDLHEHNLPSNDNKTVLDRSRRSISGDIHRNRYIETLVVVDKMMMKRHGKARINTYVLTVFNMVSKHLYVLFYCCVKKFAMSLYSKTGIVYKMMKSRHAKAMINTYVLTVFNMSSTYYL